MIIFIGEKVKGVLTFPTDIDYVLIFQDAQMMGGDGLFDLELLIDIRNRKLFVRKKKIDDGNAYGMSDRAEGFRGFLEKIRMEVGLHVLGS